MEKRQEKRIMTILKCVILIPLAILLIFFCWSRESGETEGAILRNIVREGLAFPVDIEICHVQDFVLENGQETMRGVIFNEDKKKDHLIWSDQQYRIHWYQLQENERYELYWGGKGTTGGWMCQGIYWFPGLHLNGYKDSYDLFYVTDHDIAKFVIWYSYDLENEIGEKKTQVEKGIVSVETIPELICIPNYLDQPFATKETDEIENKSCSIKVSSYDAEGNLLYGEENLGLHNIYNIEKY